MTTMEKFETFEDFETHFRANLPQMIKMNEFIFFCLFYSKYFNSGSALDIVRDYYQEPTVYMRNIVKSSVRTAYCSLVNNNSAIAVQTPSNEELDQSIKSLHSPAGTVPEHAEYVFPYTLTRFKATFYKDLLESYADHYIDILSESGHLIIKKSFVMVVDKPFNDDIKKTLMLDWREDARSLNLNQLIQNLDSRAGFYENLYRKALNENRQLQNVIDSMSQQISNQSLTRWY